MLERQLQQALDRRMQKGTLRDLTIFPTGPSSSPSGESTNSSSSSSSTTASASATATLAQPLVDFSSNDYLSLSTCAQVRSDFLDLFRSSSLAKMGSTGSRLLDGNSSEHEQLEVDLARHFASPSSLLFNSGYDANVSLFSTLPQPDDFILYDHLVHASVHDGVRKSRTRRDRRIAFRHNSPDDLERILAGLAASGQLDAPASSTHEGVFAAPPNVFLAIESVYSMDGDTAPLARLLDVLDRHVPDRARRCVVVDEAHSTAVYGRAGRGYCHALALDGAVDVRLMTFGKGMGSSGAVVLCRPVVRHFLINYARPLIFSTSLSHPSLVSIRACLLSLQDGRSEQRARRLFCRTRRLVRGLRQVAAAAAAGATTTGTATRQVTLPEHLRSPSSGLLIDDDIDDNDDVAAISLSSPSPIIPLLTSEARPLAAFLRQRGLLGRPICYPTVPKGEDRVRICLHADNTVEDVDRLVGCIAEWLDATDVGGSAAAAATMAPQPLPTTTTTGMVAAKL
ncbi:uncharacterized protein PFL1_02978 [Pseudozyma flocculosa PF-1]|uniref:Related to 8-amino-7-oxononanoate synthase n=2 Tax=Pseudozyma flocculosa TaxID=84751 RepID=A0A5C3F533_9BASI|nr:uncharacterized protein PFL1_02978 [Pseudozyma flocculosa PF-1]EPQ29759.1 hypothetical protein PFL1_02978 [Pseudozyma flocculosa PF-1]SPO38341.1 related to 8-amino-7-oxononanoate synthase [Pseudozyma flocculosa]